MHKNKDKQTQVVFEELDKQSPEKEPESNHPKIFKKQYKESPENSDQMILEKRRIKKKSKKS